MVKYLSSGPIPLPLPSPVNLYSFRPGVQFQLRGYNFRLKENYQFSGTATASIPVPIGYQDWQFVSTAVQNAKGKWERHGILTASGEDGEGFVPSTPYDNAIYGYPQWSYLSSLDCGVSQEDQQ
jgi:hypothetical protein